MRIRRRSIGATAVLTLMLQVAITAFAAISVCVERPHTHGGIATPDCAMHHQSRGKADAAQHHAHHEHATDTDLDNRSSQQITCRCPSDPSQIYLGQVAVLQAPTPRSPFVQAVLLKPASHAVAVDQYFSPPSPPPR